MKISTKAISLIIVSALGVSMAMAQGGGGRGQGRGGGFGQRGGFGQPYELTLLNRKDVQKDLGLSDDQVTKIDDYIEKNRPQRGGGAGAGGGQRGNGGGGQRGNGGGGAGGGQRGQTTDEQRAAMMKAAAERREKTRKDLMDIISEAQLKRVDEIHLQLQGNLAILEADVQKSLGLSSDQTEKIKDLQTKMSEANRGLNQKVRDQEITREDMLAKMKANNDTMKSELGKILTSDQAAKLKAMQGKAFTADEDGN